MILRWLSEHRERAAAVAALIAVLLATAAAGGFEKAHEGQRRANMKPGASISLARWELELPEEAMTWRGTPYSDYVDENGSALIGASVFLKLTESSDGFFDSRLFRAHVSLSDGSYRALSQEKGFLQYLERDGASLPRLQPGIGERVLLAWELPKKVDPKEVRALRLTVIDEHRFNSVQGAAWTTSDRVAARVVVPVRAVDPPKVPKAGESEADS